MTSSVDGLLDFGVEEKKRLVVFVGGFDPRGARYYHQLMRSEAKKQKISSGSANYIIGKRNKRIVNTADENIHSCWSVEKKTEQEHSCSELMFFDWHDEVKSNWPAKRGTVFLQAWSTYFAIWKLRKWLGPIRQQARYTLWALMYPLVYSLLVLVLGLTFGGFLTNQVEIVSGTGAAALVLAVTVLVGVLGLVVDRFIHVSWLLRILNFANLSSRKKFPILDERFDAMAQELSKGMQQERWREVVIVGFSVGSVQAVKLTAALRCKLKAGGPSASPTATPVVNMVNLVTLGNCIPLFALFPGATDFRRQLREVANDKQVYWADISSPSDSVCFGMCDVVGLSLREDGIEVNSNANAQGAQPPSKKLPQWGLNPQAMCSPRFHKLFLPETYRWLRKNKMRMHFQYLMAGEVAGAYDYFELLTAPGTVRSYIEKKLVR